LHQEFLRLGSLLMTENADLFHQAIAFLSAKHNLKVATPATSISDVIPSSRYNKTESSSISTVGSVDSVAQRGSFRRYVLCLKHPEKEFYQCTICKQRCSTNSFGAAHMHGGSKLQIRWHCPICDSFFAVTHRGYHVRRRHSDSLVVNDVRPSVQPHSASLVDPVVLRRPRDDEQETELAALCPVEKGKPEVCGSPSTSPDSVSSFMASTTSSCCSPLEEVPEEDFGLSSVDSMSLSSSQNMFPLFHEEEEENSYQFPSQGDEDFFETPSTTSPCSF